MSYVYVLGGAIIAALRLNNECHAGEGRMHCGVVVTQTSQSAIVFTKHTKSYRR